ncbi:DNA topoisomerase 3 [Xenorhabdus bovienii]|uniref:DNA topoisomerase 3 n=1 Tax=Xenorhabdus bovienii TaxID=40576 RepID=UPI003DA5D30A
MSINGNLFIAEKPSVAKAIAAVLGITGKGDGYIECGSNTVTWCFGHMLEQAEPDEYTSEDAPRNPKNGKKIWRVEDLPIIPETWIMKPREDAEKQLKTIQKLLKSATTIVNAGDPDREGQLLVDEILDYYDCTKPVLRYWVSALDETSVKRGLDNLKPNETFRGYGVAAQARGRYDWLSGMNLTRAYTLRAIRGGSMALLTVGRVQTPTLALVVERDEEIEEFKPKLFYKINAAFQYKDNAFVAAWNANEEQQGLDSEGRLVDMAIAKKLATDINGKLGRITEYKQEPKKKDQPTVHSLTSLTLLASNKFGYSASDVLNTCQSLYETHKLTSYPRTDCKYLPESQHADARIILDTLKKINPELVTLIDAANPKIKSKTWNDAKITAHHGIIPTMHQGNANNLSDKESNIYELIIRSYLAQFYSVHEFLKTTIKLDVTGEIFETGGNTITTAGWKDVYAESDDDKNDKNPSQTLVPMQIGDEVTCLKASLQDTKTKAPSRFNDGTLSSAMENIHKYVVDSELKKLLREGDGIGTVATRASIIDELRNRNYLELKGKQLISTTLGRSLVKAMPEILKSAVLTALNERSLIDLEKKPSGFDAFMEKQNKFITDQVIKANDGAVKIVGAKQAVKISTIELCKICGKGLCRRLGKKGFWWTCSGYPECNQSYPDAKGRPNYSKGKE